MFFSKSPQGGRLLVRTVPPAGEPITRSAMKHYLRVTHDEDDAAIDEMITAARMAAEQWMHKSLMTQQWKLVSGQASCEGIWLSMGPVQSVVSVTLVDASGASVLLGAAQYRLNIAKTALAIDGVWDGASAEIVYQAGFGAAGAVPGPILQGMMAHVARMYDGRAEGVMPDMVAALYMPFKEVRL